MSFGLPSLLPKPEPADSFNIKDETHGIPNPLVSGLLATKGNLGFSHPLEASEKGYKKQQDRMNLVMLRNVQGLHAPLRLAMELKAADAIGRLPFLPSSNVMRDVLLGQDEEIGFDDILNIPEFREHMGQPHAVVEKSLGIL